MGYCLLSLLYKLHNKPFLLRTLQRCLQENIHQNTLLQVEIIQETLGQLLWIVSTSITMESDYCDYFR